MSSSAISRRRHYASGQSVRESACVIVYYKLVSTNYKPLVGILPNLQVRCSWGHRWLRLHFEVKRSKVKVTAKRNALIRRRRADRRFVVKDRSVDWLMCARVAGANSV